MQLRFDLLLQNDFTVGENLLDVRTQFARLGIDDLQFFLDAESENVIVFAPPPSVFFFNRVHSHFAWEATVSIVRLLEPFFIAPTIFAGFVTRLGGNWDTLALFALRRFNIG